MAKKGLKRKKRGSSPRKPSASKRSSRSVAFIAETALERHIMDSNSAVVVKFWDGESHLAEEAFEEAAGSAEGVKFLCVQLKGAKLKKKFSLKENPTFVFFHKGSEKSRIEGPSPREALEVWCELNAD